jgi:HTH-type transcriptional regulator/antitoxin HigA
MGTVAMDERRYGKLLASALPRVIRNDEEFDRAVELLESLHFPERRMSAEEAELADLLQQLIQNYDDHVELPDVPPNEMVQYLLEQRGLRPVDLAPAIGSRAQVSDLLSGRRGVSKAQAKKLAEFFGLSVELFI